MTPAWRWDDGYRPSVRRHREAHKTPGRGQARFEYMWAEPDKPQPEPATRLPKGVTDALNTLGPKLEKAGLSVTQDGRRVIFELPSVRITIDMRS